MRQDQSKILKLDIDNVFNIVQESLHYIVDARVDTEIILQFAANIWAEKDTCKFLQQLHERMANCSGFDEQCIPEVKQIKEVEFDEDRSVDLMQGFDFEKLKPIK